MTMSNREAVRAFFHGATSGGSNNIIITENTLYSYGTHFPMAKRTPHGLLINSDKYSMTTSHHQALVESYSGYHKKWYCPMCDPTRAKEEMQHKTLCYIPRIATAKGLFEDYVWELHKAFLDYYQIKKAFKVQDQNAGMKYFDLSEFVKDSWKQEEAEIAFKKAMNRLKAVKNTNQYAADLFRLMLQRRLINK